MNNNQANDRVTDTDLLSRIITLQSRLAAASFELTSFMQLVVEQVHELTKAAGVVVELVEGDEMVYRATTGTVAAHIGLRLNRNNSISGLCVAQGNVLRSDDTELDPRVNVEACRKVKARSLLVAPLFYAGNAVGVLKIMSDKPHGFNEADVNTLQLMASFIAAGLAHQIIYEKNNDLLNKRTQTLTELEKTNEKLLHVADHDFLTGLPNRKLFNERLSSLMARSKRNGAQFALMYLDIDHFKDINDKSGHETGDELLKLFSARLLKCVREYDTVARLGGDEFIVMLEDITEKEDVLKIATNIIASMHEVFKLKKMTLQISCSIGVTFYSTDTITAEELIHYADKALYIAKNSGRNRFEIYK